jgi:nitrate reductase molybdenum cofactor assembly chaperone NarJ/NarW
VAEPAHPLQLVSLLLAYPTAARQELAADVAAGEVEPTPARGRQAQSLRAFCDWYAGASLAELERRYVTDVDFAKRASLHLTFHVHGDRRQRGIAMLRLKEAYRAAGFEPPGDELPDYLPLMLEFAALAPPEAGLALLEEHRVSIELVRAALADEGSPWAPLLDVVIGAMGRLSSAKLARVRRLAAEGPPHEEVGLEPFAPPEVMPVGDPAAGRPLAGEGGPR